MFPFIRPAPGRARPLAILFLLPVILEASFPGINSSEKHVAAAKAGMPHLWASVGKSTEKPKELWGVGGTEWGWNRFSPKGWKIPSTENDMTNQNDQSGQKNPQGQQQQKPGQQSGQQQRQQGQQGQNDQSKQGGQSGQQDNDQKDKNR
jgi:hypothetical protein